MRLLGNIIWHIPFMGFVSASLTYLFGLLLTLTVVAAPVGLGLMELGKLLFWPFGKAMIKQSDLNIEQNPTWEMYSKVVMIVYLPFGLIFAIIGVVQMIFAFISILGIPVAIVVAKSLSTFLNPVGKKCVSSALVAELERQEAQRELASYQKTPVTTNIEIEPISPIPSPSQGEAQTERNVLSELPVDKSAEKPDAQKSPDSQKIPVKPIAIGVGVLAAVLIISKIFSGSSKSEYPVAPAIAPAVVKEAAPTTQPTVIAEPAPQEAVVITKTTEPTESAPQPVATMLPEPQKIDTQTAEVKPATKISAAPKKQSTASNDAEMDHRVRVRETIDRDKAKLRETNAKLDELLKN